MQRSSCSSRFGSKATLQQLKRRICCPPLRKSTPEPKFWGKPPHTLSARPPWVVSRVAISRGDDGAEPSSSPSESPSPIGSFLGHFRSLFHVYTDPVMNQRLLVLIIGQVGGWVGSLCLFWVGSETLASTRIDRYQKGDKICINFVYRSSLTADIIIMLLFPPKCPSAKLLADAVQHCDPHTRLLPPDLCPRRARSLQHQHRGGARHRAVPVSADERHQRGGGGPAGIAGAN